MPQNSGHKTSSGGSATGKQEEIDRGISNLDFAVSKSIRYHSKRRRFFENLHCGSDAISAISGSAAVTALLSGDSHHIAIWLSAIVAVSASCDLVVGFSRKSQQYDALLKRFSFLLKDMKLGQSTANNLAKWTAERILIEKDEPTFLTLLVAICDNEERLARGKNDVLEGIPCWRRWLSNLISFDGFSPLKIIYFIKDNADNGVIAVKTTSVKIT